MTCTVIWDTVVEVEESEGRTPQWVEANVAIPLGRDDAPFDDNDRDMTVKVVPLALVTCQHAHTRGRVHQATLSP